MYTIETRGDWFHDPSGISGAKEGLLASGDQVDPQKPVIIIHLMLERGPS